ncbi:sensor histidine kinase [Jannaschia formosa]|uniref:sensor histidine kinase n=1 Tax=Jannaschia formosa TaxID=2259592 RepID=UPI000E1C1B1B|nr:sensor histidine kinase [Jannaschia formosa]TFL15955.1 sensor histidine kinase [Jannaschia formosa]
MLAALHEQLYSTDEGDRVDLARYVKKVTGFIAKTRPSHVEIRAESDTVHVSSQQAASIGIILNEFATNSFKHAFPEDRPGLVSFTIRRLTAAGEVELVCEDDGIGMNGKTSVAAGGLGMKIAEAVSTQVGGVLSLGNGAQGVRLSLRFSVAGT